VTLATLELDGLRYEYDDVPGLDDRAPLLFLHEGLGSVGLWRGFHHRVATASGRRAIAYSRLGHGWSDLPSGPRPTTFMADEAADVLPRLCASLGLERPVLVGHSDGGTIALLAAAGPLPVTGVVVLAPHTFVEQRGIDGIAAARTAYDEAGLREKMIRHHRDADVTFRSWNDLWLSREFRDWDVRGELSGITAPVLAMQGDDDPYGTLAHVESVRDRARGDVRIVELPCGHSPHLELPDQTDRAVVAFLGDLP
jgi:pimeloyl-ACP methyl ester carboxylesterase